MKWLVRFCLSLCLFYLSRSNHLNASAHQDRTFFTIVNVFADGNAAHCLSLKHQDALFFKKAFADAEKVSEKIGATDKDEEDDTESSGSSRKYLEISSYFTDFFYTLNPTYFWQCLKKSGAFYQQFSHFSSRTYLLLQVFRI